jgi:hypothetical protein
MKEILNMENAKQIMKDLNVVIYGTVRDIENDFFTSFTNLDNIASYFNKVFILIFENDSKDKTPELLNQWLEIQYSNKKIYKHVIFKNNLDFLYPLRAHRLAYCRNCILNYIVDNNLEKEYQYAIHCDLDDRFWSIDYESIATCFQYDLDSWDAMTCVNKNRNYYDFWALRCDKSWFNINIFSCNANDIDYNTKTAGFETLLKNTVGLIDVTSSFNGLGIYKLLSIIYCRYNAEYNCKKCKNVNRGCWEDNDHIGLHKQMIYNNCKLFINNKMYIQTKPKNSINYNTFIESISASPSIDKNILYYLLIGETIDKSGKWLLIEIGDGDIANVLTNYYHRTLYTYSEGENTSIYLNKNIEVRDGNFYRYSYELNDISEQPISFIYINCYKYHTTKNILSVIYNKIKPGCIILFDKLINYKEFFLHGLKALYEFFQEYEISFKWLLVKDNVNNSLLLENQKIALIINENKHFNTLFAGINYSSEEYEKFNWVFYSNNYEDLIHIKSKEEAYQHWILHGKHEGRVASPNSVNNNTNSNDNENENENPEMVVTDPEFASFDWEIYVELNKDLKTVSNKYDAFKHWKDHGVHEGRICKFDWCTYIKNFNLITKSIDNKIKAIQHWIENGRPEINNSQVDDLNDELFDWEYYLEYNKDLKNITTYDAACKHWKQFGKNEKRVCHNFKWTNYLLANSDLVESGITNENLAIYHWLKHGKYENRKIGL